VFAELRAFLEARRGPAGRGSEFTRILQLLSEHPVPRVAEAVAACRSGNLFLPELIASHAVRLSAADGRGAVGTVGPPGPAPTPPAAPAAAVPVPVVQVPMPDLRRFDRLIAGGD
jgi:hypothetical protein